MLGLRPWSQILAGKVNGERDDTVPPSSFLPSPLLRVSKQGPKSTDADIEFSCFSEQNETNSAGMGIWNAVDECPLSMIRIVKMRIRSETGAQQGIRDPPTAFWKRGPRGAAMFGLEPGVHISKDQLG